MKLRGYELGDDATVGDLRKRGGLLQNTLDDPRKGIAYCLDSSRGEILILQDDEEVFATTMVGRDGHRGRIYNLSAEPYHQGENPGRNIAWPAEQRLNTAGVWKTMSCL